MVLSGCSFGAGWWGGVDFPVLPKCRPSGTYNELRGDLFHFEFATSFVANII